MNLYRTIKIIAVNTARFVLGLTFVFSGFVKAVDPLGTQYKIHDYLVALDLIKYVPDFVTLASSVALSLFEFWLGISILFAIRRKMASRLSVAFMLVFTAVTVWIAVADPVSECGCFGDAIKLTNVETLIKNIILLVCAVVMAWSPLSMRRFVSESNQWIVMNYTVVFLLAVAGYSLYYLPMFDFRPYHEGAYLKDNLDFFVYDEESGDDLTDSIVSSKGYTFLLVSPRLETADDSQLDLINEMYEYSQNNNYAFLCLTASDKEAQEHWNDITGAEYGYYQADDITLKTMIRSNPGVMLIKDGQIIRKWSHNTLPDEYVLDRPLTQLQIGKLSESVLWQKVTNIIVWFVLPLLLLTLADRIWAWSSLVRRKKRLISLTYKKKDYGKENCSR